MSLFMLKNIYKIILFFLNGFLRNNVDQEQITAKTIIWQVRVVCRVDIKKRIGPWILINMCEKHNDNVYHVLGEVKKMQEKYKKRSTVKACNKEAEPNFYGKLYLWRHKNNNSTSCENESINNF